MQESLLRPLAAWDSFYVIVGSAAGALTGLQFIVLAFVTDRIRGVSQATVDTFTTPSIVHFSVVLLTACILSAPWPTMHAVAVVLAIAGFGGALYTLIVARRASRVEGYKLVVEDWIWHVGLPLLAYVLEFGSAIVMLSHTDAALFVVATMSLLLLFIGIHAAWDTVTYVATEVLPNAPRRPGDDRPTFDELRDHQAKKDAEKTTGA